MDGSSFQPWPRPWFSLEEEEEEGQTFGTISTDGNSSGFVFSRHKILLKSRGPGRGGENGGDFFGGYFWSGEEQFRSHSNAIKRALGKAKKKKALLDFSTR